MLDNYKNNRDWEFVYAAERSIIALEEFMAWADMVMKKMEADPNYKLLMGYAQGDWPDEKRMAEDYKDKMIKAITALKHPEQSTPQDRRTYRMLIAQAWSWRDCWEHGATQRDMILDRDLDQDHVPLVDRDWPTVVFPSTIPTATVPAVLVPDIPDPFGDNQ